MTGFRCCGTPWLLTLVSALLLASTASAEPSVWAVAGRTNTVYLFGSVHLLADGGFGLTGELERAYRDAGRVCLEVDIGALTPAETASITLGRAIDPEGRDLFELLGASTDQVLQAAAAAEIDLAPYAAFEPWFAGLTVSVAALQRHGYTADFGVEQIIESHAKQDGKPGCGLETLDEQLGLLDALPAKEQQELLLQSLRETAGIEQEIRELYEAWQGGDDGALARLLETEFSGFPELAARLVYARNERWASQIAAMLDQPDDVLVVVGALHLVGDRGLPALLRMRGHSVRRR